MAFTLRRLACLLSLHGLLAPGLALECEVVRLPLPTRANHWIGLGVAATGQRIAVGGGTYLTAYVFESTGSGWSQPHLVHSMEAVFGDTFGSCVALDNRTLAVGAPTTFNIGIIDGAAYVFEVDSSGEWGQRARVLGSRADIDPGSHEYFGHAIALDGDTLLIGAYGGSEAYIFTRSASGAWTESQRLDPGGGEFGRSVALEGDIAVIGAPADSEVSTYSGAAYIFERDAAGNWAQVIKLLPDPGHSLEHFGISVAVHGGVVLAGSELGQIDSILCGTVSVFERAGKGTWSRRQVLFPPLPQDGDAFGTALSMDGRLALVGAVGYDQPCDVCGAAFVYERQASGEWVLLARLSADDGQRLSRFGRSVALSGNLAVVGAPFRDEPNATDAGAAYLFAVSPDLNGNGWMDACECPGDVNHDWSVGGTDLAVLLSHFGAANLPDDPQCANLWPTRCAGDLDADADVDLADLAILLANFGASCPSL